MREAKRHEAEDRGRKELVEARNTADALIYQMEKTLRDLGDQVSASDRGRIEGIVEDLKRAKEGDDAARIRQLIEQLQQASYAIGQQMYAQQTAAQEAAQQTAAQQQPAGGPQAGPGGFDAGPDGAPPSGNGRSEEEVVEGEFHEV